jgi:glycosyltransferase involved in cell wall biosynthesis
MRIAIVAPPWLPVPPPAYGGTEAVIDGLARGLVAAGHEVLLIAHPDSTCPVPRASVVAADDAVPMGRAVAELQHALGAYELAEGFDVVSDHTVGGPVVALSVPDLPVVATNHNPFTRGREALFMTASRRVAVVAISHSHASTTDVPIAAVIHHGIDVDDFPVGDGGGGYAAALTRMSPDKGVDHAARLARAAGHPLRIAAKIASPVEQQYFDEHVRPLLGGDIEYIGEVDASGKRELLAHATMLLNPTAWAEPFGMTMLESLACGTPVVATRRGAATEIVVDGTTGFLGETDDELIRAISNAAQLDRAECRRSAVERFSVTTMCARYVDAYEHEIANYESRRARSELVP